MDKAKHSFNIDTGVWRYTKKINFAIMTTEPARLAGIPVYCDAKIPVEIFQVHVITLAGWPSEWTKWETRRRVTHCSCTLFPRLMWAGAYCELYCHAVCTWKLWNLLLLWFVYERIWLNLINPRVLKIGRRLHVKMLDSALSTVQPWKKCSLFTRSFCSIRF